MTSKQSNLKKFQLQLEGLDIAEKIFIDILTDGLASLARDSEERFENYAQIMSNHYLPFFQSKFEHIASSIPDISNPRVSEKILHEILNDIVVMQSSVYKIRTILQDKLNRSDGTIDPNLRALTDNSIKCLRIKKNSKYNVCIFPLSFHCVYHVIKDCWYQQYYWIDMEDGSIYHTTEKLTKKPEAVSPKEPLFKKHRVLELYYEPDVHNGVIHWNKKETFPLDADDYLRFFSFAEKDIPTAVSKMKSYIKNTQAEKYYPVMLPVSRVGMIDGSLVIEDNQHNRIVCHSQDCIDSEDRSIRHLMDLPYDYQERQSIFGILFYDASEFSIYFHPHTLFAQDKIYRLID